MAQIEHPIAHIRSLADAKESVTILSALSVLGSREGPFTLDKLEQLIAAESHFRMLLRREITAYFIAIMDENKKGETDAFAKQMQLIHSYMASAFQRFVMNHEDWWDGGQHRDLLQRATGLAAANFGGLVKWSYFLHETLKGTSWSELHALYYFAEQEGFHQTGLNILDPGGGNLPSVHALYLRALMLDVINAGGLSSARIEIAEGWLSDWCSDYALETEYAPRSHLIYVDLAEHSGFHVMVPGVQGDTIRYLRADALRTQIEAVKNELRSGRSYRARGSQSEFPVGEHVALLSSLEHIYHAILANSGNRVEERVQASGQEVEVLVGLENILLAVGGSAPSPSNAVADDAQRLPPTWKVHDYSSTGFGLLIDRPSGERVPMQNLIALRASNTAPWALATIVRKLTNRIQGQTLFGVEILSYRPLPVTLKQAISSGSQSNVAGINVAALYVPGKANDGKRDFLVLRLADFAAHNVFELATHGAHYRVRLNRTLRKGRDWVALRFEVESKR